MQVGFNNPYNQYKNKVAFGHNKGFLEAAKSLQQRFTVDAEERLQGYAETVDKSEAPFMTEIRNILNSDKTPKPVKKLIKELLNIR